MYYWWQIVLVMHTLTCILCKLMDSLINMKYKSLPLISNTQWGGFHDKKTTNLGYDKIRNNGEYSWIIVSITWYKSYIEKVMSVTQTWGVEKQGQIWFWFRFIVFYATLNNISVMSWRSVLLVEETGVPGENHRPVASHWETLSHKVVSSTSHHAEFELTTLVVIVTDCTGSCKSKYHATTTAPKESQRR